MISVFEYPTVEAAREADLARPIVVSSAWPYWIDRVEQDCRVWYGDGWGDYQVLRRGMLSDGASVPWFFRRLFPTHTGAHWAPALMHDGYYGSGRLFCRAQNAWLTGRPAKREADRRFYRAMLIYRTPRWRAWCMYQAVRWFGGPAWNANRKNDPTTPQTPTEG